ncbi:ribosome-binding factor A [Lignipirellula cremea]|uniref:Ribosome-binding factor A n=1 Tax=Lignipirellula cremea TaxID=2528010 RepID=A0A518DML2_9BACT|nr:hypothetical protein [Lignipirellula cremea]QDU93075.1 ribosome-binding factor A [Lignipirellula cremea]
MSKSPRGGDARPDRKTLQLCRQIEKALSYAFSLCNNELVSGLQVDEVVPAPNAARLMVFVSSLDAGVTPTDALAALHEAAPQLRTEVAASINRSKTPDLIYQFQASGGAPGSPDSF